MDLISLLIAASVFFLAYQGLGLISTHRGGREWESPGYADPSQSPPKALWNFSGISAKLGFNRVLLRNKMFGERLDLLLLRSGYPFGWKAQDLLLCKELMAGFIVLMLWRAGVNQPLFWVIGVVLGFLLPDVYIRAKGTARRADIQRQLPGFIDLSSLALESGLDLMSAIERIIARMKPNSLREELYTLLQENRLGTPRKEALEHLAYRVNLPDVQSLTSIIIQSEELGTSLAAVLRNYAEDMRTRRILRAEEIAGKAPVKLLFPMMVFFFPIVFVIIFGPLALSFMSSYK